MTTAVAAAAVRPSIRHEFDRAVAFVRNGGGGGNGAMSGVSQQRQLQYYAYYKQATEGPCSTARPGLFNPKGRAKWDAWQSIVDVPAEKAMRYYVACLNEDAPQWRIHQVA